MTSVDKLFRLHSSSHGPEDDGGSDNGEEDNPAISASEDEEDGEEDARHTKLLDAISSMDAKKKSKVKQRSEPSAEVSEFQLNTKEVQGKGVWIHDLMGSLHNTQSHSELKKQMNSFNKRKLLPTPLHQHEADKIQRKMAYETVSKEVSKWNHVVRANRHAEQLSFPLHQEVVGMPTTDKFVKKFKPQTPLEQEVYKMLHGSKYAERPGNSLTQAEEEAMKAMSLEEARERRAELQKHRALMSYFEAKCRRQKKIKSKKFHRFERKAKARQESRRVEELMKTDPEAAQETLVKMEKARAEERMSLKHRNTGKWAKTLMKFGRYSVSARQELAHQLQKSQELTEKVAQVTEDNMQEEEEEEEDEVSIKPSLSDINNPWFTGGKAKKGTEEEEKEEEDGGRRDSVEDYVALEEVKAPRNEKDDDDDRGDEGGAGQDDDVELVEDQRMLKMIQEERRQRKESDDDDEDDAEEENVSHDAKMAEMLKHCKEKEGTKRIGTRSSGDTKRRNNQSRALEAEKELNGAVGDVEEALLDEGLDRRQTEESLEDQDWLNRMEEENELRAASSAAITKEDSIKGSEDSGQKASSGIVDPNKVFTIKSREVRSVAPELVVGGEDEAEERGQRQHRMNIEQAFATDDVVDQFAKEKAAIVERDKPKDIDLTLPGWGAWGGLGVQPPKKKPKRSVIKAKPQAPRKDSHLQHVIINEERDKKVAVHQVNSLPFPFTSPEQFERSIRAPVGSTWNTPSAVKALTKPKVTTKMGAIIEPIQAEETFREMGRRGKGAEQRGKRKGPRPDIMLGGDDDGKRKAKKRKGRGELKI